MSSFYQVYSRTLFLLMNVFYVFQARLICWKRSYIGLDRFVQSLTSLILIEITMFNSYWVGLKQFWNFWSMIKDSRNLSFKNFFGGAILTYYNYEQKLKVKYVKLIKSDPNNGHGQWAYMGPNLLCVCSSYCPSVPLALFTQHYVLSIYLIPFNNIYDALYHHE